MVKDFLATKTNEVALIKFTSNLFSILYFSEAFFKLQKSLASVQIVQRNHRHVSDKNLMTNKGCNLSQPVMLCQ